MQHFVAEELMEMIRRELFGVDGKGSERGGVQGLFMDWEIN